MRSFHTYRYQFKAGQRFRNLTVLYESGKHPHGDILWKCQCDCGNFKEVRASHLIRNEVKSCGCLGIKYKKEERNDKYHFQRYKKSAKKRQIAFNLNFDEFIKLTHSNCYYCDQVPTYKFLYKKHFYSNGIDRINSDLRI